MCQITIKMLYFILPHNAKKADIFFFGYYFIYSVFWRKTFQAQQSEKKFLSLTGFQYLYDVEFSQRHPMTRVMKILVSNMLQINPLM